MLNNIGKYYWIIILEEFSPLKYLFFVRWELKIIFEYANFLLSLNKTL